MIELENLRWICRSLYLLGCSRSSTQTRTWRHERSSGTHSQIHGSAEDPDAVGLHSFLTPENCVHDQVRVRFLKTVTPQAWQCLSCNRWIDLFLEAWSSCMPMGSPRSVTECRVYIIGAALSQEMLMEASDFRGNDRLGKAKRSWKLHPVCSKTK